MNSFEHARAWADVMRRCQQAAEAAKKEKKDAGAEAEIMMLGFAAFADMISAAYRKINEPH